MKIKKELSFAKLWRVIAVILPLCWTINAPAQFSASTRSLAWACWSNNFYNTSGNYINNQQGTTSQMSFWQMAETIEMFEDAVGCGLTSPSVVNQLCINFTNVEGANWNWNSFNDDLGWAAMAFCRAYAQTGNQTWLTLAENGANEAWSRGWDPNGGGMYQQGSSGGMCTCANTSNGGASWWLYQALGNSSTYLTRAQDEYNWMLDNVWNSSTGEVVEGPGSTPAFSYDSGGFASLSFWLGNLGNAKLAGQWVQNEWGTAMESFGQGSDAGGFNGICLRGLARTPYNMAYLQQTCAQAWNCRNASGLTVVNFGGGSPASGSLYAWDCTDMIVGMCCAPATPADITSGGLYELEPDNASGKRLDVIGQGGSGTMMDIWTDNNGNGQIFQVNAVSGESGVYQLVPQCSTGSRLDVQFDGTDPGSLIDIYTANGGLNQNWIIIPVNESSGIYMLAPQNATNLRLDVVGDGTTNGTKVDAWTANNGANQNWTFIAW